MALLSTSMWHTTYFIIRIWRSFITINKKFGLRIFHLGGFNHIRPWCRLLIYQRPRRWPPPRGPDDWCLFPIPYVEVLSLRVNWDVELQGFHGMFLQIALFRLGGHPYSREVTVISTDGDTNKHHVEGNRYDRHDLVNGSSVSFNNKDWKREITRSTITYSPLLEERKQISVVTSAIEYKIAASMSTRIIGIILPFVLARILATSRSIAHIRYASNPGQIQSLHIVLTKTGSPELNTLAAIVEIKNPMTHVASPWSKALVLYCEAP